METIVMDGKMGYENIRFGMLHGVRYFPLEDVCRALCIFSQSVNTTDGMLANVVRRGEPTRTETVVTEMGMRKIVYSKFSDRAKRFQTFLEGGSPEQNVVALQPVQTQMVVPQPEPIPEPTFAEPVQSSTPNPFEIFTSEEFGKVRVVMQDGEPWFVAVDVCDALDIGNSRMAVSKLDEDEKGVSLIDTLGGQQKLGIVNEPGLYVLVLSSRKKQAKGFRRWIAHEVIPSIRKHGAYATEATIDKIIDDPDFGIHLLQQLKAERAQKRALEAQNAILQPKAEFYDDILNSESTLTTTDIAKDYNMSAQGLNAFLKKANIQFYQSGRWYLYQKYAEMGLAKSKTPPNGRPYLVWTQEGRKFIHDLLKSAGIYPNPAN